MFAPDEFEIINAHPFIGKCDGAPCGKPETMEEFVYEMKKVKVDYFAGSLVRLHPVTDYAGIRKLNEDALRIRDRYPSCRSAVSACTSAASSRKI